MARIDSVLPILVDQKPGFWFINPSDYRS